MMYLLKKDNEMQIVPDYNLSKKLEQGWKILTGLENLPKRIQRMPMSKRKPDDIVVWYQDRISKLVQEARTLKSELNGFVKMLNQYQGSKQHENL